MKRKKIKRNYAFDFAAAIESFLDFEKIPIADLCEAMRKRLNEIERLGENHGAREAFGKFDEYEVEEDAIKF